MISAAQTYSRCRMASINIQSWKAVMRSANGEDTSARPPNCNRVVTREASILETSVGKGREKGNGGVAERSKISRNQKFQIPSSKGEPCKKNPPLRHIGFGI